MHSHKLEIGGDWASQIAEIRDEHSVDTNLIRFDNTFYRYGRAGPDIEVCVVTSDAKAEVRFKVDPGTFYMAPVKGRHTGFKNYSFELGSAVLSDASLDGAVQAMAKDTASFTAASMLVFAVAESIRFDHLATDINSCFLKDSGKLLGERLVDDKGEKIKGMRLDEWSRTVHGWGQASKAALSGLDPSLRGDIDASLRHTDRYQRVIAVGELDACLRRMKVINRSTSQRDRRT